jgi:hypothetical protein
MNLRTRSLFGSGLLYMGVSLEGREEFHDKVTVVPGSYKKHELVWNVSSLNEKYLVANIP